MNNLKLSHKILLANIGVAILLTAISLLNESSGNTSELAFIFGIACLILGIINLLIALVFFLINKKEWQSGFLITAGLMLLLSGISCGGGAMF